MHATASRHKSKQLAHPDHAAESPVPLSIGHCWGQAAVRLFETGILLRVTEGQTLFRSGEPLEYVYYVEEGALNMFIGSPGGAVKVLGIAEKGGTFGELFALLPEPIASPVTAVAASDTAVRAISRELFRRHFFSNPDLSANLAACIYQKMLAFVQQIEDLSFRNVKGRVASLLAARAGAGRERGIAIYLNQDTISNMVAAHRVSVSRALRDLEDKDLVVLGRNRLYIMDPDGLRREASGTDR